MFGDWHGDEKPPRGIFLLTGRAAERLAERMRAGEFSPDLFAVVSPRFDAAARYFAGPLQLLLGFGIPVALFFVLFDGDIGFFFHAAPRFLRSMPLWQVWLGVVVFVCFLVVSIHNAAKFFVWRDTVMVDADRIFARRRKIFRWRDVTLPRAEVAAVEWVRSNGGYSVRLLSRDGGVATIATTVGPLERSAWLARLLRLELGVACLGNVPLPEADDRKLFVRVAAGASDMYERDGESQRAPAAADPLVLDSADGRFQIRRVDEGDDTGFEVFQDLRNYRAAAVLAGMTTVLFLLVRDDWHRTARTPKQTMFLYLSPLLLSVLLCIALDGLTGKIRLRFFRERLVRRRFWMGLTIPEDIAREEVDGIELFRDTGDPDAWLVGIRMTKSGKAERIDALAKAPYPIAASVATLACRWSGAPLIERPMQSRNS